MSTGVEDEKLMAYVDGELSTVEQAEIEALLAQDADLRARAEIFREGAELARRALEGVIREPVPEAMLAGIEAADRGGPLARLFRRAGNRRPRWIIPVRGFEVAAAACLLLIVGGVAGSLMDSQFGGGTIYNDQLDPRVASILSTATSGAVVALEGPNDTEDVLPLLTFVDGNGRYCRHYLQHGAGPEGTQTLDGVACIDEGGDWQRIITVDLGPGEANGDGYVTASGGDTELVDGFINQIIEGAPIVGVAEGDLISSDWTQALPE